MISLPGPTNQPILEGLRELPCWKSSQTAGLMTWEPAYRNLDAVQPVFLTHIAQGGTLLIGALGQKRGCSWPRDVLAEASPPAPRQTCRAASWAHFNTDLHWTKLTECVFYPVCSFCLLKESSDLQISMPSAPREGCQEWPRAGKGPSLSELSESATELFRPSCWCF